MSNLALTAFVALFLMLGARRPFIWVLCYLYVDIVSPQKVAYPILGSTPLSLIVFCLAVFGWLFLDNKQGTRFSMRQGLILMLLAYSGISTMSAAFPTEAAEKWDWVWKALVFAMFLPMTLRTRLRIEAAALTMVLSVAAIILSGAIKTALGGGGYGVLRFIVDENTGLFEGSTISCVAIAIIPLVLWLTKFGTIYKPEKKLTIAGYGLIAACLLIPIGTEARTGLICAALLAVLMLRSVRRRSIYVLGLPMALMVAVPLLPNTFTTRMDTIQNNESDESASTRIAVWKWTLGYAADHPLGGGFNSYLGNHLKITTTNVDVDGSVSQVHANETTDNARAFHSAYFEMLGEQGWPGLLIWLVLQITGITQLEGIIRRFKRSEDPRDKADSALATALQQGHFVYLFGALFVGIAYQPFIFMLIGLQIALAEQVRRRQRESREAIHRGLRGAAGAMAPVGA